MSMKMGRSPFMGFVPGVSPSSSVEEEQLADAQVRLQQAKLDAILGINYDPDEYDRKVERYRAAKRWADEARWASHLSAPTTTATKTALLPSAAFSSRAAAA